MTNELNKNILAYQGSINQNKAEIPFQPRQKRNTHKYGGILYSLPQEKNSIRKFLRKFNIELPYNYT